MLAIGRSLMSNPKLLCLDEPSNGLAPNIKKEVFKYIEAIYQQEINMLLVEQDVSFAFKLSNRSYVMSKGRMVAQGTSEELLSDERVRKVYLGI